MTPTTSDDAARRPVGPIALLALGVNGIVGVGIFFVPADLGRLVPGGGSVLVFLATALALLPVALVFARLGRRFDVDGGPVVYARAALGPFAAFVVGWISYVSAIASAAAVMTGLTAASGPAVGVDAPGELRAGASAVALVLAAVVASGLAVSARTWTFLTALKLMPLLLLAGLFLSDPTPIPAAAPAAEVTLRNWLAAGLAATFALQGFEIVPVIAGRTQSPERWVPLATVGSLLGAALLYVILQFAAVATLPALAASGAPLAETAHALAGSAVSALVAAGTSVSALGIALGMMVTTPHYLAALAREGTLAGRLDVVDARGVPRRSLAVTAALVLLLIQLGDRGQLFALASVAVLTQYLSTAVSLHVLARRGERGLRASDAWPAAPAALVALALVSGATMREAVVAGAALLLGLALRAAGRPRPAA